MTTTSIFFTRSSGLSREKVKQVIDYKEYEIHAHSLFFISPGQLHYFEEWQPIAGVPFCLQPTSFS